MPEHLTLKLPVSIQISELDSGIDVGLQLISGEIPFAEHFPN
jgi:hypothetical protein